MDILGDASLALRDFLKFGLDGPTKYDSTGERYLRLYGVLSGAYTQQQAALKLHKLMHCSKQREFRCSANELHVRVLRHQLASHSLDYTDFSKKSSSAFVPVRIELGGFNCTVTENRGDRTISYDLKQSISAHCEFMLDVLDAIYEKGYKSMFKANAGKLSEYENRLKDLRGLRDGDIIIRGVVPGSRDIVVRGVKVATSDGT